MPNRNLTVQLRRPVVAAAILMFAATPRMVVGQAATAQDEYYEDISATVQSLTWFWTREFTRMKPARQYTALAGGISGYDASTAANLPCSGGGLNAYYCSQDDGIHLEEPHFMRWYHKEVGDFAPVVILAHEWGHAIQGRLGFLGDSRALSIQTELQADCLGGAWTQYLENESTQYVLEPGDVDEAILGLFSGRDAVGTPWLDPRAHGTASQRIEAFTLGRRSGAPRCFQDMPLPPKEPGIRR